MLRLIRFLKPYWWQILILVGLVFVQVITNLQLPSYTAKIVNQGIVGNNSHVILSTGGLMLLVSLLGAVCTVGVGYIAARVGTGFSRTLRERVFSTVESFSLLEFNKFSTASLITRSTNDIQQIQLVMVMLLRLVVMAPVTGIWAVVKAYQTAPSMTWIMALSVGVMLVIIVALFSTALPRFRKLQKLVDRLNLVTREILTGLRVIRAFNTQKREEEKFNGANVDLTSTNLFINRLMSTMQPAVMLVMNFTTIGVVWLGAHLINAGNLQIGDMIAFMQYAMQAIFGFMMMSFIFILVPRASVSAQRVDEVIRTKPAIRDPENAVAADGSKAGLVEFDHVSFAYAGADEPVLKDLSFTAKPGETTAIIGSTGSGKSTLVNLIPRLSDATGGSLRVGGVDVREQKLVDLRAAIGYVPQTAVLFSGTVDSNIKYGAPEASEAQLRAAAKTAQAAEFITELDGGYEGKIAQGGANISGGQKQRLSIARAIVRDPAVYVFDDSFSALDFRTDANLRAALAKEVGDKTVIIVAQRVSTIMAADKIIVLEDGRIVGQGTHRELLSSCPVYKEIASSQLSDKELATGQQPQPKLAGGAA